MLAQQLAYVIQRRGWVFQQEIPSNPASGPYTWYADQDGESPECVTGSDGKDAWLFSRKTLANLPKMYDQVKNKEPDVRYVALGKLVPPLTAEGKSSAQKRPDTVPAHLGLPRAMLKGFFRTMDASQGGDSRLVEALEYMDLEDILPGNRKEAVPSWPTTSKSSLSRPSTCPACRTTGTRRRSRWERTRACASRSVRQRDTAGASARRQWLRYRPCMPNWPRRTRPVASQAHAGTAPAIVSPRSWKPTTAATPTMRCSVST